MPENNLCESSTCPNTRVYTKLHSTYLQRLKYIYTPSLYTNCECSEQSRYLKPQICESHFKSTSCF